MSAPSSLTNVVAAPGSDVANIRSTQIAVQPPESETAAVLSMMERTEGTGRHAYIPMIGKKFGRLTVISQSPERKSNKIYWICRCECGVEKSISGSWIRHSQKSCGCARDGSGTTRHGLTKTSEHSTWRSIIQRCCNPKNPAYENYGGRGISICDEWLSSFDKFITDMGRKPSKQHTIERVNNNIGYCKSNCEWRSRADQSRNTRTSRVWLVNEMTFLSSLDAARYLGVSVATVIRRCNG